MTADFDIPKLGYGTWNRDKDAAYQGVLDAIEIGYTHIDTAPSYQNEDAVGKALKNSGIDRDSIFVTTKVDPHDYGEGEVLPAVKKSLEKLQLDKVDLLVLHFPSLYDKYPLESYVAQFVEVFDMGLAQHIGVSNFTIKHIEESRPIFADRPIYTNQVEIHPYMQNRPIVDYCQSNNIHLTAYSPLARGAMVDDPVLAEIGKKHNASTSQIALAFLLNLGYAVIPSSDKRHRIQENFDAGKIQLPQEEMAKIAKLERGMRLNNADYCPKWDE